MDALFEGSAPDFVSCLGVYPEVLGERFVVNPLTGICGRKRHCDCAPN